MSVQLKITLGTVNYTGWIHVTAAKVSSPTSVAWEAWFDAPLTANFNFIIPGLDPENYLVTYYDASTDTDNGNLIAQLVVNALTSEVIAERRFYTCNGGGPNDPAIGASGIQDDYLIGKKVTGTFKEGFRFFEPITEYSSDDVTGEVEVLNGTTFEDGEKFIVELTYSVSSSSSSSGSALYNGNLNITEATRLLLSSEVDKRCRLVGTAPTQVITLCSAASVALDRGFYFDNSCGGVAVQVKILTNGADRIRFNGFMAASDLFAEFWVSKGEHLLIRKFDDNYWEVILDYKGVHVGERLSALFKSHPNTLTESGQLIDGDEYPRLWWWIKNVLPVTHWYTDDTVTGGWSPNNDRLGQFAVHSTLKKFRMPVSWLMSEKNLQNSETYGTDITRTIDYPGGFQAEAIGAHTHDGIFGGTASHASASTDLSAVFRWLVNIVSGGAGDGEVFGGRTGAVSGTPQDNTVKNIGVIYCRRI